MTYTFPPIYDNTPSTVVITDSLPSNSVIGINPNTITITPGYSYPAGLYPNTIYLNDLRNAVTSAVFNVLLINLPPIFTALPLPDVTVYRG